MPEDKLVVDVVPPVPVTIVGTGTGLVPGTQASTPHDQPNVVLNVISPLVAIAVRFINTFLVQLVGLLVAAMTPEGGRLLYTGDFLQLVMTCAALSVPAAGLGLLKDCVTIFGRLEGKYPLWTGGV